MSTALRPPNRMTASEFYDWSPPAGLEDRRWQLVDGEPVCMAPASENHGAIQNEIGLLIGLHLREHNPSCRVIQAPGVIPRVHQRSNVRVPDLGVTCSPPQGGRAIADPVLLIEILSPSNEADTRRNVWAYATIPSVVEILLLSSTEIRAELLRRDAAGEWPSSPRFIELEDGLHLASIGFEYKLRGLYRTTNLAPSDALSSQPVP